MPKSSSAKPQPSAVSGLDELRGRRRCCATAAVSVISKIELGRVEAAAIAAPRSIGSSSAWSSELAPRG